MMQAGRVDENPGSTLKVIHSLHQTGFLWMFILQGNAMESKSQDPQRAWV